MAADDHISNKKISKKMKPVPTTSLQNMPMPPMYSTLTYTDHSISALTQMGIRHDLQFPYYFPPTPLVFQANSPPSSPSTSVTEPPSPAFEARKLNNNNLVAGTSANFQNGPKDVNRDRPSDRPFTCDTCNRSFGYKHVLKNHKRTHTGEKPFECPECHKWFSRDHHLKIHMRNHTGEKPYHCEHCDKKFRQVANLRRHLRVHTVKRPHACEHCQAKISDSNQLKAHHTDEKLECERCQNSLRSRHQAPTPEPDEPEHEPEIHPAEQHVIPPSICHSPSPMRSVNPPPIVPLPEQTEPVDLSMSTGLHSQSSRNPPSSPSFRGTTPVVNTVESYMDPIYSFLRLISRGVL